jgi:hypothetical protein
MGLRLEGPTRANPDGADTNGLDRREPARFYVCGLQAYASALNFYRVDGQF